MLFILISNKFINMEGIIYLKGGQNDKKYVQIDLEKYGDLWPDLLDIIIASSRKNDKKIPFKDVKNMVLSGNL